MAGVTGWSMPWSRGATTTPSGSGLMPTELPGLITSVFRCSPTRRPRVCRWRNGVSWPRFWSIERCLPRESSVVQGERHGRFCQPALGGGGHPRADGKELGGVFAPDVVVHRGPYADDPV